MERELRLQFDWVMSRDDQFLERDAAAPAIRTVTHLVCEAEQTGLDIVDYLLAKGGASLPGAADTLDDYFREAGSKWCVSATRDALEERVATEAMRRAAELITTNTRAAQHLGEAWHATYGRNPNPSHAYREAIRAVEATAIPVVSPKNAKATLGTVIADMRNAPQKRTVVLNPAKGDPVQHVIGMMELLWTAQIDRHGTADESVPLSVTREEAEAAVHLALTLTHWFQIGLVR
jgi:hypothetical protein